MKIKTLVERDGGVYEFTAELSELQHQFLIEWALKDLLKRGLIPFGSAQQKENISAFDMDAQEDLVN